MPPCVKISSPNIVPVFIKPGTHGFSVLPIAIGMSYATLQNGGANLKKKNLPQNIFDPNVPI
jgi:hypothetical protein